MNQNQAEVTNIYSQMGSFFRAQCRSLPQTIEPLIFKVDYKNSLKIVDHEKIYFSVDQTYLNNYRSIYTDKNYKYVKLHNWQFQIQFLNKAPLKIFLISSKISFLPIKGAAKDLQNCHFKVNIASQQSDIRTLTPQILGYLNRLGKKNIIKTSLNVAKELRSLLNFAKKRTSQSRQFSFNKFQSSDNEQRNTLQMINNQGRQIIQKLRHFISPQDLQAFLNNMQMSNNTENRLKRILAQVFID